VDLSTTLDWTGDLAAATNLFSTERHVGQSAAARIVDRHATTVVDDVECQHVGDTDLDSQS
jgi:hypothetical protein